MANKTWFSVIGYDHRTHVFELLRKEVDDPLNQEIKFISFLEDSQPYYIIMLVEDISTK